MNGTWTVCWGFSERVRKFLEFELEYSKKVFMEYQYDYQFVIDSHFKVKD